MTKITDMAITAYNELSEEETAKKNKIYNRFIYKPFDKLAEITINNYNWFYIKQEVDYIDMKYELLALLQEKIHKYHSSKGQAFAYFSRVLKNHMILKNQELEKEVKRRRDMDSLDTERNVMAEEAYKDLQEDWKDFTEMFVEYMDDNLGNYFSNRRDVSIADSVLELFRHRHLIETYNKKALYILIRERTRLRPKETQYITKVVNKFREIYADMFEEFRKDGTIKEDEQFFF
jgi:hypothetical protein